MKVVKLKTYIFRSTNFTGISILSDNVIRFYKKGFIHKNDSPAYINIESKSNQLAKLWCYNGITYGFTYDYTNKTWNKKAKQLKLQEKFKIFI